MLTEKLSDNDVLALALSDGLSDSDSDSLLGVLSLALVDRLSD